MHDVCLNTLGVWAQVERAQRALDHQHASAAEAARSAAREHLAAVRRSAAKAASVTPEAAAWRARAEAEATRLADRPDTEPWRIALAAWEALRRPYHAAYARWRLVEALLATASPADRGEATGAVREAHRIASDLGAAPLRRALAVTAQGARLDLKGLPPLARPDPVLALGLTKREGEVLRLLTRGYTNREIATELTISVKTASVHVSHILQKLGVPRRINAAAIGQRLRVADGDAVPS
jgi:DNA-binding CsgD family transcriptional regulator